MVRKKFYPVNLDLNGKSCLVIGGGKVAARKARSLLACGARVTVVSPGLDKLLAVPVRSGRILYIKNEYQKRYLKGCFLAIAATDDPQVNRLIYRQAIRQNILINVVDVPGLCSFIVPSIVRRGPLVLGISTSGESPMYAQKLRKQCAQCLTNQQGSFVTLLGDVRQQIKSLYPRMAERKLIYRKIQDSPILALMQQGKKLAARSLLQEILAKV